LSRTFETDSPGVYAGAITFLGRKNMRSKVFKPKPIGISAPKQKKSLPGQIHMLFREPEKLIHMSDKTKRDLCDSVSRSLASNPVLSAFAATYSK
jgi:hypothetical protein